MTSIRFFCILTVVYLQSLLPASGQTFQDFKKKAMSDYKDYKTQTLDDFKAYRKKINAEYAEYLKKAWEWKKGDGSVEEPERIPDIPPVILPVLEAPIIPEDYEIPFADVITTPMMEEPKPVPLIPLPEKPESDDRELTVTFYGTECKVRYGELDIRMPDASEASASDMWTAMSSGALDNLLYDCNSIREKLALCDWAYYLFVRNVSERIYGQTKESVMLNAFIMNQSGFRIRLGRSNENCLHILYALSDDIYDYNYWNIEGTHFYLLDDSNVESMYISDLRYPQENSLRLSIRTNQNLSVKTSPPRRLKSKRYQQADAISVVNFNLLDLYRDYPHPYMRGNTYSSWAFYANAPVSEQFRESVYPVLKSAIAGKTQSEAAELLINFVQTAFDYKTDAEVWGYERSFFPDETLYYPYCDCEDRAILFSRLVRDLLKLDVVLVYYPGHLATAVRFEENVPGDYITLDSGKYLICDPTYINASVGMTMPDMDNSKAIVIML